MAENVNADLELYRRTSVHFQNWYDCFWTLQFDTNMSDLDLHSGIGDYQVEIWFADWMCWPDSHLFQMILHALYFVQWR